MGSDNTVFFYRTRLVLGGPKTNTNPKKTIILMGLISEIILNCWERSVYFSLELFVVGLKCRDSAGKSASIWGDSI